MKVSVKIYQARNGAIMLLLGRRCVELSAEQIECLGICVYDLDDFSLDDYKTHYLETDKTSIS